MLMTIHSYLDQEITNQALNQFKSQYQVSKIIRYSFACKYYTKKKT